MRKTATATAERQPKARGPRQLRSVSIPAKIIPIELIDANPDQPRKHFDAESLEELAASIRENGLLQPVLVRPLGKRYQLIAGERRWRAHQHAQMPTILARVVDFDDRQVDIAAIVENLQRVDISPLEEAFAYQRLLDTGLTVEALGQKIGLKQPWRISERTSLLRLLPEYQEFLAKGHLSPSQGFELSRLSPENQKQLFNLIASGRCDSYAKLRAAADGFVAIESQEEIALGVEKPTAAEVETLTKLEKKIERVCELVGEGFEEGEIAIVRKINPHRASILAIQLGVLQRHLAQLEKALMKASVQAHVASEPAAPAYH